LAITSFALCFLQAVSRNVHFISGLMERKIDFVACDMPSANAFMINIYAAVAQEERRMISVAGMSARAVAAELNARGIETPTGAPWSAKTVIRARERLG
jgi:DNA invertase Pin-like site-specific DNA recombinase